MRHLRDHKRDRMTDMKDMMSHEGHDESWTYHPHGIEHVKLKFSTTNIDCGADIYSVIGGHR